MCLTGYHISHSLGTNIIGPAYQCLASHQVTKKIASRTGPGPQALPTAQTLLLLPCQPNPQITPEFRASDCGSRKKPSSSGAPQDFPKGKKPVALARRQHLGTEAVYQTISRGLKRMYKESWSPWYSRPLRTLAVNTSPHSTGGRLRPRSITSLPFSFFLCPRPPPLLPAWHPRFPWNRSKALSWMG